MERNRKRVQVRAYLRDSKVIFHDEFYLDWILYHYQLRNIFGENRQNINRFIRPTEDFEKKCLGKKNIYGDEDKTDNQVPLPIVKVWDEITTYSVDEFGSMIEHKQKGCWVYLSSKAILNPSKTFLDNQPIRKRFETKKAERFMNDKVKIQTSMWKYRNYNINQEVVHTPYIERICMVNSLEELQSMLDNIQYIGKDTNIWYGWIDHRTVTETEKKWLRAFPSICCMSHETIEEKTVIPPYSDRKKKLKSVFRFF